jgi:hypothetical protein
MRIELTILAGLLLASAEAATVRALSIVDLGEGAHQFRIVSVDATAAPGGNGRVRLTGPNTILLPERVKTAAARMARNWPASSVPSQGATVHLGERWHRLDMESADLAINLSLDALAAGVACDPDVAVTGVMPEAPEDSRVLAVNSLARKIRESAGGASILVVPDANREDLVDLLVMDGISPWLARQIFTVGSLEEARRLVPAPESRDALLNEAMRLFGEIRTALGARPRLEDLRQQAVQLRLRKVLELEPGHASARMLLAIAEKRTPARLSLLGSLRLLDSAQSVMKLKDPNALFQAASTLNRQRPILAPEVQVVWDVLEARLDAKRRLLTGGNTEWVTKARQAEASFTMRRSALDLMPEVPAARARLDREP